MAAFRDRMKSVRVPRSVKRIPGALKTIPGLIGSLRRKRVEEADGASREVPAGAERSHEHEESSGRRFHMGGSRVGIAALASFLILVTVLVVNRFRRPATTDSAASAAATAAEKIKGAKAKPSAGQVASAAEPKPKPEKGAEEARRPTLPMSIGNTAQGDDTPPPVAETVDAGPADDGANPPPPTTLADAGSNGTQGTNRGGSAKESDPTPSDLPPLAGDASKDTQASATQDVVEPPPPVATNSRSKHGKEEDDGLPPIIAEPTPSPTDRGKPEPVASTAPSTPADAAASGGNRVNGSGSEGDARPPAIPAPDPATSPTLTALPNQPDDEPAASATRAGDEPAASATRAGSEPAPAPAVSKPDPIAAKLDSSVGSSRPPITSEPADAGLAPGFVPLPNAGTAPLPDEPAPRPARPAPPSRSEPIAVAAAAGPAAKQTVDDRVDTTTHIVQKGENFWTISKLYYNSGRYYKALWAANRETVPKIAELYVGTTIKVPPPELLDAKLIEPPRPAATARRDRDTAGARTSRDALTLEDGRKGTRKAADTLVMLPVGRGASDDKPLDTPAPTSESKSHVVKAHETLRSIARDRLGDPRRAEEIREMNLDELGEDPPRVGMTLRLPDDAKAK